LGALSGGSSPTVVESSGATARPSGTHGQHAVLVELFTSEGCSSSPPADDLLRRIAGKQTDHGTLLVGLSEHVTYWDHDGWKDPFGSDIATERQSDYARRFQLESVYTPQMVVNGESQFVGVDASALVQAVQKAETEQAAMLTIATAKSDGNNVDAQVSIAGTLPAQGADMFAVVAEDETTQHVLRGENAGRTLAHASVARTFVKIGRVRTQGINSIELKLPKELPASPGGGRHLVVWLQEPDAGHVLGVDSRAF